MKQTIHQLVICIVGLFLTQSSSHAQITRFDTHAEYEGALINGFYPTLFFDSGRLGHGRLSRDYQRGAALFKYDTNIYFYEDGTVRSGELKEPLRFGSFLFQVGPVSFHPNGQVASGIIKSIQDGNLVINDPGTVTLSPEGKITSYVSTAQFTNVLGRNLTGSMDFLYEKSSGSYRLYSGTVANAQIIGRVIKSYNEIGQPKEVHPIITPRLSFFRFNTINPNYTINQQAYDIWKVNGASFTLNDINYGIAPMLLVRGTTLLGVNLTQSVNINGVEYKAGTTLNLDLTGKIINTISPSQP